jgi:phosphatidylserine decarboxylase
MSIKEQLFICSQYLAPHHLISRLFGGAANCRLPAVKNWMIDTFIRRYGVNMKEALHEDPHFYGSFNEFFTRALKPLARIPDTTPGSVASPADGAISQLGPIEGEQIFQAKGHHFTATDLLGGDPQRAVPFRNGHFATVYLAPRDYHRVHMPIAGTLRETIYIPGRLFSVNPATARNVPNLFARNERLACIFDTEQGPLAVVLVGAMIVGSIETVWGGLVAPHRSRVETTRYDDSAHPPVFLQQGAELGRFRLGSTVVMLFSPRQMRWADELINLVPVRMGQNLVRALSVTPA